MNWPPSTRRFLFWTILTAVFHGLLCQLLAAVLNLADGALTQHRYWSVLLWLPLARGLSVIVIPALTVGFTLGHERGIYKPLVTLPLGVLTYWVYRWWFWVLPWFVEARAYYIPFILLSAWLARWGYGLAARWRPEQPLLPTDCDCASAVKPLGGGWKWTAMILFFAVLLAHAYRYMPIMADDAMISARYAERLLEGKGLTWTDGPPVEGYSNLLWILATASLGYLGVDLLVALRILGCGCMAAVMVAIVWFYGRQRCIDRLGVVVGLIFFSCSFPIGMWSIAGLEQPLVAVALTGAILAYWLATENDYQNPVAGLLLGAFLGILCLTRPDGPLFTVALAVAFVLGARLKCHRWSWPFLLTFALIPFACYAAQLAFRLAYYHDWVPNTAYAKVSLSWYHVGCGWDYVRNAHRSLVPLSTIAMIGILFGVVIRSTRSRFIPLAVMLLLWIGYLIGIGGDIFAAHRHYIPVIVILTFVLIEGTTFVVQAIQQERAMPWPALWTGAAVFCGMFAVAQYREYNACDQIGAPLFWDAKMLGEDLRQVFGKQQPLLAVTGAGGLPYWSKLPCLDMLGLNDYYLAHHRPKHMGNGLLGHELGDGEYILRMKPDLILCDLGGSPDPTFSGGKQLSQSDVFAREYARIQMKKRRAPGSPETPFAYVWVRRDSEKIGIRTSADHVTIPAYFFATEALEAFPHDTFLAIAVDAAHPADICLKDAETGGWKAEVHGPKPDAVDCHIRATEKGLQIGLTTRATAPVIVDEVVLHR